MHSAPVARNHGALTHGAAGSGLDIVDAVAFAGIAVAAAPAVRPSVILNKETAS